MDDFDVDLEDVEFDPGMVPWDEDWASALDQPWYTDVFDWLSNNAGSLLSVGSGLYGAYQGREMQQMAQQAFGRSDPFGPQRAQYAEQLSKLMADPSSIKNDPGYKQAFDQGQLARERSIAARGLIGSGNAAIELQEYGQTFGMDYLNNRIAQLAGLAGANIGPNFGAAMSGYGGGADLQSQGLASIGYGLGRMMGGGASAGTPAAAAGGFNSAGGEAAALKSKIGLGKTAANLIGSATGLDETAAFKGLTSSLGAAGDVLGLYTGLEKGNVQGYLGAARSGMRLANLAGLADSPGLASLGKGLGVLGAAYGLKNTYDAIKTGNAKMGALSGLSAGASIGSIVPGIGTLVGAGVGAVVGAVGSLIHGKDNPEEKLSSAYYGLRERGQLQLGATSDQAFTDALVGEFRRSRSSFPARLAGYGTKDDDKWAADLAGKINSAYKAGSISKTDDAFSIYEKVVSPWFQSQGGWRSGLQKGEIANMESLTLDTIHRYISGRPITWQEARGNRPEFAVEKYLGVSGAPNMQWGTQNPGSIANTSRGVPGSVLEAMRNPGKWMTIQPISGGSY